MKGIPSYDREREAPYEVGSAKERAKDDCVSLALAFKFRVQRFSLRSPYQWAGDSETLAFCRLLHGRRLNTSSLVTHKLELDDPETRS